RDRDHRTAEAARAEEAERLPGERDGEPGLPAAGPDCPVLDADSFRDREEERPRHLRRRGQAVRGPVAAGVRRGAAARLGGAAEHDATLDPGLVVDHVARPAVADDQLQVGESLEHLPREARTLLRDDHDLVAVELLYEPLRRDRLAVDRDLGVAGQRRPVAVVQGDANVVVEDRDLRHACHLTQIPAAVSQICVPLLEQFPWSTLAPLFSEDPWMPMHIPLW